MIEQQEYYALKVGDKVELGSHLSLNQRFAGYNEGDVLVTLRIGKILRSFGRHPDDIPRMFTRERIHRVLNDDWWDIWMFND